MSLNIAEDIKTAYDEVRSDSNPINWYVNAERLCRNLNVICAFHHAPTGHSIVKTYASHLGEYDYEERIRRGERLR